MTKCQTCGTEILGRDRFCRQCGAQVVASVADLVDTQQLPYSPGAGSTTHQFYAPPVATTAQPPISTRPTGSFTQRWFRHKAFRLVIFLICLSSLATGIGIFAIESRQDQQAHVTTEEAAMMHQALEVAVQNALGFKHASATESGLPNQQGIFVNSLMSDESAAAVAKLQAGDLLIELNGQAVNNENDLERILNGLKTGDEVPLKIYREGVKLDSRIHITDRNFPPLMPKVEAREQGFLGIKEANRRCCIPGTQKWGIEVSELYDNGPADLFGLKPGDVITEFNDFPTRTTSEFNRRIRAVKPRSHVTLKFFRGNTEQTVEVLIGHRWE